MSAARMDSAVSAVPDDPLVDEVDVVVGDVLVVLVLVLVLDAGVDGVAVAAFAVDGVVVAAVVVGVVGDGVVVVAAVVVVVVDGVVDVVVDGVVVTDEVVAVGAGVEDAALMIGYRTTDRISPLIEPVLVTGAPVMTLVALVVSNSV
jgi:hypothetical protein